MNRTIGIAGFGRAGRIYFETLRAIDNWKVVGIADPSIRPGTAGPTPIFKDHLALLDTNPEAIIVATPPQAHYEIAEAVLRAGKNVLIEKPPTNSVAEATELRRLSGSQGKTLFFGYHARYNRAVDLARRELKHRRVRGFRAVYKENVLNFHDHGWVLREGVLRDSGINVLSILTTILPFANELRVVRAKVIISKEWHSDVEAMLQLAVKDHYSGSIEMDWRFPGPEQRRIEITTETGTLVIDISQDRCWIGGAQEEAGDPQPGLEPEYARMVADFINCVESGESSCGTEELRLLQAAYDLAGIATN